MTFVVPTKAFVTECRIDLRDVGKGRKSVKAVAHHRSLEAGMQSLKGKSDSIEKQPSSSTLKAERLLRLGPVPTASVRQSVNERPRLETINLRGYSAGNQMET